MSELNVCSACGATETMHVSGVGSDELWRCGSCQHEKWVHVVPATSPFIPDGSSLVLLVVWWRKAPPPAAEVLALRRFFPEFASVSVSDLMRKVALESRFVIGRLAKGHAMRLLDDAAESGLDLRIEG